MVTYKGATIIGLPVDVKGLKVLVQGSNERPLVFLKRLGQNTHKLLLLCFQVMGHVYIVGILC